MCTTATVWVGVDGTAQALDAVRWAAGYARSDGATLRLVHAFDEVWADAPDLPHHAMFEIGRTRAEQIVADADLAARALAPTLRIIRDVELGDAANVLRTVAAPADTIVVGHGHHHGATSRLPGSIGHRLATRAPCPVTVVRGRSTTQGPVVVGVGATATSSARAIGAAFHQAAARNCPLVAVRTYVPALLPWRPDLATPAYRPQEVDAAERDSVEDLLAPTRRRYPDVPVTVRVLHGTPAAMLVKASHDAQLVVVGDPGHLAGAVLGAVGRRLLHHANCPVMIVPRTSRREAARPKPFMATPRPAI